MQLTAVNAQTKGYEGAYLGTAISAGNSAEYVGKTVVQELYNKYGTSTQLGKATISVTSTGSADASNLAAITGGSITIYTTDFKVVGTVVLEGGTITWGTIGANNGITPVTPPTTTYTITYNANGGSGEMTSTTGEDPEVATNDFTAPTSGQTFVKWNTSADGTGTDYAVGAKPGASVTLYAQWTAASTGSVSGITTNTHTAAALTMDWSKLNELAIIIANNTSSINNTTREVTVNDGTQNYTLGVGDYLNVYYNGNNAKQVRILGFNHDSAKEETGISFEFVNPLGTAAINTAGNNTNGWKGTTLRPLLNSTETTGYLGKLKATNGGTDMSRYIKEVKKDYLSVYNRTTSTDLKTTGVDPEDKDKLWLLSCTEVWGEQGDTGCYSGYCVQQEGSQYAYYANKTTLTWNNGDGNSNYLGKGAWW